MTRSISIFVPLKCIENPSYLIPPGTYTLGLHRWSKSGRLVELTTKVTDKPGSLLQLIHLVSQSGANILTINHSREDRDSEVGACIVSLVLETRNSDHVAAIKLALTDAGYPLLHNS